MGGKRYGGTLSDALPIIHLCFVFILGNNHVAGGRQLKQTLVPLQWHRHSGGKLVAWGGVNHAAIGGDGFNIQALIIDIYSVNLMAGQYKGITCIRAGITNCRSWLRRLLCPLCCHSTTRNFTQCINGSFREVAPQQIVDPRRSGLGRKQSISAKCAKVCCADEADIHFLSDISHESGP